MPQGQFSPALKRCGDNGGRNSWGEACRRIPPPHKQFCDLHDPELDRCQTPNAKGEPCGKQRIVGGRTCYQHGSGTMTARTAARQHLFEPNFAAIRYLREALDANDKYLAFKAAAHITRLCNAQRIEVEHTGGGPPAWLRWLPVERRAQLAGWVNEARAAMARGDPPIVVSQRAITAARDDDAIDAEVTPIAIGRT